ncbi:MAG: NAD-binding protein, partial [bacterium]
MDIVIAGAGQVGRHVAQSLSQSFDVALIDLDPDRVETAQYELDVMGIEGDATDIRTLKKAGVADC